MSYLWDHMQSFPQLLVYAGTFTWLYILEGRDVFLPLTMPSCLLNVSAPVLGIADVRLEFRVLFYGCSIRYGLH